MLKSKIVYILDNLSEEEQSDFISCYENIEEEDVYENIMRMTVGEYNRTTVCNPKLIARTQGLSSSEEIEIHLDL